MRGKGLSKRDIDRLLQSAFRDDMSNELEEQIRQGTPALWRHVSQTTPDSVPARDSSVILGWFLPILDWRRALLTTCAVMMIISAGALRLVHSSSFLTESLALQQTALSVIGRLQRAQQMECLLQTKDKEGVTVNYAVFWAEGQDSRAEIEGPAGREVRSVSVPWIQMSVVHGFRQKKDQTPSPDYRPQEPWSHPIRDFLNAPTVARLLQGQWQADPISSEGNQKHAAFLITSHANLEQGRVVIDLQSYLPVSYVQFPAGSEGRYRNSQPLVSAEFRWENRAIPPRQRLISIVHKRKIR